MSVEMQRVYDRAAEYDKSFLSTNDRYRNVVMIVHEEGTILWYRNAFVMKYYDEKHGDWGASENPGQWIMVFTEHHGFHVYPIDDLHDWCQFQRVSSGSLL